MVIEGESLNQEGQSVQANRPRVYIASLADYNAGRLLGRWIDASQSAHDIQREVGEMLRESSEEVAEDWAIHDYEHFGELTLSEFEDVQKVAEVAQFIRGHGLVFASLVEHLGGLGNLDEAKRYMEEGYRGEWDSLRDYAEQLVEDCYGDALAKVPAFISGHIDYERIGSDLELGGDIFAIELVGKVHVFDAHL